MFIPLKMVCIGIDPYPYGKILFHGSQWKKSLPLISILSIGYHWEEHQKIHDENHWDNHSEGFSVSFGVNKMLKNQGMMVVHGCTVHGNLIE
jgi:hypothetical protein